jgi:hypothetical protein
MVMETNLLFEISRIKEIMKINEDENIIIIELNEQQIQNTHDDLLKYIKIKTSDERKVKNAIKQISKWPNDILCGRETVVKKNGKDKRFCKSKFKVIPTDHYLKRLYRLSDYRYMKPNLQNKNFPSVGIFYDKDIVNPDVTEGIYFIEKIISKIAEKLENIKWDDTIPPSKNFMAKDVKNKYFIVFNVTLNKNTGVYDLYLITQIKGIDNFKTSRGKNPIKLYEKKIRWYYDHLMF